MKKKIVLQSPEQCTLAINILQGIQDAMVANPDGVDFSEIEIRPVKPKTKTKNKKDEN